MKYRLYKKSKSKTYFFQFLDNQKKIVLQSQSYDNKDERDAGLQSVFNSAGSASLYKLKEKNDGTVYFSLFSKSGEEIARSPSYTGTLATNYMEQCVNEIPSLSKIYGNQPKVEATDETIKQVSGNEYATDGKTDDYQRLAFYEEAVDLDSNGIQSFHKNNEHYYCFIRNGQVIFISEGYETEVARNQSIETCKKSLALPEKYQRNINDDGKYYFNLKSIDDSEVGTSAWFDSKEELNQHIDYLSNLEVQEKDISPSTQIASQSLFSDDSVVEYLGIINQNTNLSKVAQITENDIEPVIENEELEDLIKEEKKSPILKPKKSKSSKRKKDKKGAKVAKSTSAQAAKGKVTKSSNRPLVKQKQKNDSNVFKWLLPFLLIPLLFLGYKSCFNSKNVDSKLANKQSIQKKKSVEPKAQKVIETKAIENQNTKPTTSAQVAKNQTVNTKSTLSTQLAENQLVNPKEGKRVINKEQSKPVEKSNIRKQKIIKPTSSITGSNIGNKLSACLNDSACKRPIVVHWTGPQFEYNEHELSKQSIKELESIAKILKSANLSNIDITGHIAQNEDDSSTAEDNSLSQTRAKAVYDLLVKSGLNKSSLTFKGLGDSNPLSTDYIEPGFVLNKRVDLIIR